MCIASETGANLDPVLPHPLPKWRINTTNDTKLGVVFRLCHEIHSKGVRCISEKTCVSC